MRPTMMPALPRPLRVLSILLLLLLTLAFTGCAGGKKVETQADTAPANPPKPIGGPQLPVTPKPAKAAESADVGKKGKKVKKGYVPMCENGVVKDDGQLETGYGYVPSATSGIYLQEYNAEEFANPELDHVCVCWLHKRDDSEIDFEVVFYEKKEGRPAETPYASKPGNAKNVPQGRESGGAFYDVDVSGVKLVPGTSYIGVSWNPKADPFFFVCADHGPDSEVTAGYQRDDRAKGWLSVLGSPDPIFTKHKAMMIRAVAKPAVAETATVEPKIYNRSIKKKVPAEGKAAGGG